MHILCDEDIRKIKVVRDRLYREDRLSGDDMRDLAQTLDAAVGHMIPYEPYSTRDQEFDDDHA